MAEEDVTDLEELEDEPVNRRRHPRSMFTYPVEFQLFSQKAPGVSFFGNLKDISLGGAGLEIQDQYGRFKIVEAENGTIRLFLNIPREERISILAQIQWIKRIDGTSQIKMGISFKDLDHKDLMVIEKLIGLKGKDHNMMWNLWEQYYQ